MRKVGIALALVLILGWLGSLAAAEQQKTITVTGKLVRVLGLHAQSTGWGIEPDSELKFEGKQMKLVEVNRETKRFEALENKRVEATGRLTLWHTAEWGYWPVFEVTTIRELSAK